MEILVGVLGLLITILVWLFKPEPLRKRLGLKNPDPAGLERMVAPTPIASFSGTAHEHYFQATSDNSLVQIIAPMLM